jgi:Flp pilus assembly protein TadG
MFRKHKIIGSFRLLAVMLLAFSFATAQTETARVSGTVSDAAGAVVAGATVRVTNLGTNRSVETVSNEDGTYSILSLPPGRYRVEVTQANFKKIEQEVNFEVAQQAVLDFNLEAGAVTETVTVTTDVPLVESTSSAIGGVTQGREIVELPLNGRNVLELVRLRPGVTQGIPDGQQSGVGGNAETYRGGNTGGAAISVNGQRTQANNFLLDGVDNNESLVNTINIFPQAEAVQEFRVQTSVAQAEFGRGGGAIINSVIKSGTNDFYGSAFVFVRNSELDARPTFDTRKSLFRRGQFGGTLGGPIFLPAFGEGGPTVFSGKDRLFFFVDYEGLRQFLPRGRDVATVPTAAFRRGDFSALLSPNSGTEIIQITDPLNNNAPILNNRLDLLPGNRLNPIALNYLNAFPLPNIPGAGVLNNYEVVRSETLNQDTFDLRIDGIINDNNQIFGRGSYGRADQDVTSRFPNLPAGFGSGTNPTRTYALVLGLNTSFSSNLFNELRLQASRIRYGFTPPLFDQAVSANLGIPNANRDASLGGGALIGGFNGQLEYTGDEGLYSVPQNTYQIVDSVSYTTGNHTLKFGGTILRRQVDLFRPRFSKGYFFLPGNGNAEGVRITGFEQSDLLIGFVRNYQIGPPTGTVGTRNWENALFAQDDWKVNSRLTLNLGLRYEYLTLPTEENGRQANFNLETGRLVVAEDGGDNLVETDKNNFSPRVGFAYDLSGNGRSVIRGGYGLFYFLDRGGIDNQLSQNPPFGGNRVFDYRDGFRITLSGQAPLGSNDSRLATGQLPNGSFSASDITNLSNANVLAIRPDNETATVHQFNIQYQQQITNDTAVSIAYVGTRGRNLSLYYNLNGRIVDASAAVPCPGTNRTLGSCYPGLSRVLVRDDNGRSSYDSLQLQAERRFSRGLQFLAAYTYSRTRDNGEGAFDSVADNNINFIEPFTTSRLDFPHVFSLQAVYEIPFGRGQTFGTDLNPVLDAVLGGWQINGIFRANSGQVFDVRRDGVRVDLVGEPYTGEQDQFLVRSSFVPAPTGRFGTLERNSLRGPSQQQLNIGLTKNFGLYEDLRLQFRTEFFNIFNTPQLNPPNQNTFDTNPITGFGVINSTRRFSNRQIQFGLRLQF